MPSSLNLLARALVIPFWRAGVWEFPYLCFTVEIAFSQRRGAEWDVKGNTTRGFETFHLCPFAAAPQIALARIYTHTHLDRTNRTITPARWWFWRNAMACGYSYLRRCSKRRRHDISHLSRHSHHRLCLDAVYSRPSYPGTYPHVVGLSVRLKGKSFTDSLPVDRQFFSLRWVISLKLGYTHSIGSMVNETNGVNIKKKTQAQTHNPVFKPWSLHSLSISAPIPLAIFIRELLRNDTKQNACLLSITEGRFFEAEHLPLRVGRRLVKDDSRLKWKQSTNASTRRRPSPQLHRNSWKPMHRKPVLDKQGRKCK